MTSRKKHPDISTIIPVCENGENLPNLLPEYIQELESLEQSFEIIIAFNPSYQMIFERIQTQYEKDERVQLLLFSRNYGEGTLLQAAFDQAKGERLLTLPPYKQVESAGLSKLISSETESDILLAKRWPRVDSGFKQNLTKAFSYLTNKLTDHSYSDPGCHVRLISSEAAKELNLYGDQHRFIHLLAHELGYTSTEVELKQAGENAGRKSPGAGIFLRRLLDLLTIVFLTKFNKKPLRFFGILGSSSIAIGLIGLLVLTFQRFAEDIAMADRPSLVLFSLFLVLGIQLIGIGLIGETIIFTHAGERKEYRIRKIFSRSE